MLWTHSICIICIIWDIIWYLLILTKSVHVLCPWNRALASKQLEVVYLVLLGSVQTGQSKYHVDEHRNHLIQRGPPTSKLSFGHRIGFKKSCRICTQPFPFLGSKTKLRWTCFPTSYHSLVSRSFRRNSFIATTWLTCSWSTAGAFIALRPAMIVLRFTSLKVRFRRGCSRFGICWREERRTLPTEETLLPIVIEWSGFPSHSEYLSPKSLYGVEHRPIQVSHPAKRKTTKGLDTVKSSQENSFHYNQSFNVAGCRKKRLQWVFKSRSCFLCIEVEIHFFLRLSSTIVTRDL